MKIAITGHRPSKLGNDYNLTSPLVLAIEAEIINILQYKGVIFYDIISSHKDMTFITGMALGIDTLFAKLAIKYNIPFMAAIPCLEQDKMWPNKSKLIYYQLITNKLCTTKFITNLPYTSTCMQERNEWMIDQIANTFNNILIAVWDGSEGGTANCVKYAKTKLAENQIIYINPKTIVL